MLRSLLILAVSGATVASDTPAALQFVGCPIYRDTDAGRKSGCWLVTDPATGIRYDVTSSPTKPDWNHAVLIEGRVDPNVADACGGVVMDPVRVSVLAGACTRHSLAAEGYVGRKFSLPTRNVRPLYEERVKPSKPFKEGRFTIPFDFGHAFVVYQLSDYYMDATINYALDVQPARIEIAGNAQSETFMVSGNPYSEPASLANERADVVRRALILRGIKPDTIRIVPSTKAPYVMEPFDGLAATSERRVDVRIIPVTQR